MTPVEILMFMQWPCGARGESAVWAWDRASDELRGAAGAFTALDRPDEADELTMWSHIATERALMARMELIKGNEG